MVDILVFLAKCGMGLGYRDYLVHAGLLDSRFFGSIAMYREYTKETKVRHNIREYLKRDFEISSVQHPSMSKINSLRREALDGISVFQSGDASLRSEIINLEA